MKRFLVIFLVLVTLSGCSRISDVYEFANRDVTIEKIELLYYPASIDFDAERNKFWFIRELEAEEIAVFMEQLYELPTKRARPTPLSDYGPYIARVSYINGDTEYFGSWHIELVEAGTNRFSVGVYYFPGDCFEELFFSYAGSPEEFLNEIGIDAAPERNG